MTRELVDQADALERSGKPTEALERWRAAVAAEPRPDSLARLGRLCLREGLAGEGEQLLRTVISNYPDQPDAYFFLGIYYKEHGDINEARALLERSVHLDDWAPALVGLGHVYRRLKMADAARECFERATMLDPDESEGWFGLGLMCRFVDHDRSIQLFRKAIEADPANGAALRELGHMLWRSGDATSAEPHLRAALALDGQDAWARDYLGVVLDGTGREEQAEQEFRAAIALWPDLPLFYCHLGDVLIRLGRIAEGEHSYARALSLDVSNYLANLRMGQLLKEQGKIAHARTYIERALQADPSNREAQEALTNLLANC